MLKSVSKRVSTKMVRRSPSSVFGGEVDRVGLPAHYLLLDEAGGEAVVLLTYSSICSPILPVMTITSSTGRPSESRITASEGRPATGTIGLGCVCV